MKDDDSRNCVAVSVLEWIPPYFCAVIPAYIESRLSQAVQIQERRQRIKNRCKRNG